MWETMWEFFLCSTPSLVLLMAALLSRSNGIRDLMEEATRRLTWRIWTVICSMLKLPHSGVFYTAGDQKAKIKLVYKPTALANYMVRNCRALACAPLARWPQADPHLQIFFNFLWPIEEGAQGLTFTRECLQLHDGGIVALDWAIRLTNRNVQTKREHYQGLRPPGCHPSTPPIVIFIPNAFGKTTQNLWSLCCSALQQGFYPVVFHRRSHGGCPLATPRYQEFGDPSDLVQAVLYVQSRHPSSDLFAVSEGSGSGLLLSYLGERGSSSYLVAAACISPVFHGQAFFEMPFPKLYHEAALYYRKLQVSRYATALSSVMDMETIFSCRSLQDMEKLMFCSGRSLEHSQKESPQQDSEPRSVQTDWAAYWERNEPLRDADDVAVPVLCLCSTDDPLLPPASGVPMSIFQNNPYFILALTPQGSHCGLLRDPQTTAYWSHTAVLEYFQVVTEFVTAEERNRFTDGFGGRDNAQGLGQKAGAIAHRRRRPAMPQRERPVSGSQRRPSSHSRLVSFEDQETFTWNRSYTR